MGANDLEHGFHGSQRMHTDTIDSVFVFNLKGENKMLHVELTDKIISLFFKVYNTLVYGFLEKVLRKCSCNRIETSRA
jgi:hypothetical protein